MNLYFIAKQNGDFNHDCFVCANTPLEAVELWEKEPYIRDEMNHHFIPDRVFLVPAIPQMDQILRGPHALEWHTEVPAVTP